MAYVNVLEWKAEQVADWLQGKNPALLLSLFKLLFCHSLIPNPTVDIIFMSQNSSFASLNRRLASFYYTTMNNVKESKFDLSMNVRGLIV